MLQPLTSFLDINQEKIGTHTPSHKKFGYLLTLLHTFIGWIEVFPAYMEMADVAQMLLDHIIPWFRMPHTIQMGNGPAFTSRVVELISEALNVSWKLYILYHPQSLGKMERVNRLIKQ